MPAEGRGLLLGDALALGDLALEVLLDRGAGLREKRLLEVRRGRPCSPEAAATCAMPLPIWPAPTTPSVRISMAGLYCARADESNRLRKRRAASRGIATSGLGLRLTANG